MGGEDSRFGHSDVVIYHLSNRMRVTWHTSAKCIASFIKKANYRFFDECVKCDKIQTEDVIRCNCCMATFCRACCGDNYSVQDEVLR